MNDEIGREDGEGMMEGWDEGRTDRNNLGRKDMADSNSKAIERRPRLA